MGPIERKVFGGREREGKKKQTNERWRRLNWNFGTVPDTDFEMLPFIVRKAFEEKTLGREIYIEGYIDGKKGTRKLHWKTVSCFRRINVVSVRCAVTSMVRSGGKSLRKIGEKPLSPVEHEGISREKQTKDRESLSDFGIVSVF